MAILWPWALLMLAGPALAPFFLFFWVLPLSLSVSPLEQANSQSVTFLSAITASFTGDLSDVNLSGLYGSDVAHTRTSAAAAATTRSGPLSVMVITGAAPTATPTTAIDNTAITPSSSASDNNSIDNGGHNDAMSPRLSTGAIAGIAVGGAAAAIILLVLLVVLLRRCSSRAPKKFDRGRGITPSMVISPRNSFVPGPHVKQYNSNNKSIQTNDSGDNPSAIIHPPVIVIENERRFSKLNLFSQAQRRPESDASAYSTFRTPSPTHQNSNKQPHHPYQYF